MRRIRLLLVLLFLVLGIVIHAVNGIGDAWYLYVASILLLTTHFLFGNVWNAFRLIQKGNVTEAENILNQIKRPEWLYKKNRAYYHFIKGMIALQRKELEVGEQHMKEAVQLGLRNNNDNAMARLNLAHISFVQQRYTTAKKQLEKVKAYQPSDLIIKQNIEELEQALSKLR